MKKRMFMALAVALTGVSMVVAAGNGELKIQSETSVQKVHAAVIHQIGVEPIPATGQITIEDLLAVQGGETEDPRALEGVSDPEDVPVDEASVEDTNADEYASLAIANVTNYVNVRTEPNTDSAVVGKIYDGAVAQILDVAGEDQDWFRIISGNVEGYIKAEFFIYGDAAAEVVDNYVTRYAVVIADRLNVRQDPATDAKRIGYIDNGEKVKILAEQDAPEVITNITLPTTTYTSNAELRQGIIEYAMQYLGNRYVHGGSSLSGGTDCSGFTCFIYAEFGYSISRTPGGQYSGAGRSISSEELQPGDIVCYSSNGGKSCTHVGLYIGDGQIIHSANSRKGVIISAVDYSPIIGMRNVID